MNELSRQLSVGEQCAVDERRQSAREAEERARHFELAAAAARVLSRSDDLSLLLSQIKDETGREVESGDLSEAAKTVSEYERREIAVSRIAHETADFIEQEGLPD